MKKNVDGVMAEMTPEEEAELLIASEAEDRAYWTQTPYDELVNAEIRGRYSESQEFAILRQRDSKPDEWAAYNEYCEERKAFVKAKLNEYGLDTRNNELQGIGPAVEKEAEQNA